MHLAVEGGVLAVADHDVAHRAAFELDHGEGRILHLDVGVVEVFPDAVHLLHFAHIPQQQVQLMGRLVHQDAAALPLPGAAPAVAVVVGAVPPAQHGHHAQDGPADLPCLDGLMDPHAGPVKTALHHGADGHMVPLPRRDDPVAVLQTGGQRLFDQDIAAVFGRGDGRAAVGRVGRADADHIQPLCLDHLGHVGIRPHVVPLRKGPRPVEVCVAHRRKGAAAQLAVCFCVEIPHLAAADNASFQAHVPLLSATDEVVFLVGLSYHFVINQTSCFRYVLLFQRISP